ncbi:MAG: ribonuclease HIII [Syntrophorhabdaceae bacterium]|nr:ribonuclease HIII [Syntrophorhabdaceae bacterium]MDD5243210.1 ribonuclease HIII [Syntrophorhabdaceae bacterium]
MGSSIEFVRPIASALSQLKAVCEKAGILFLREEEVNKGAGAKLHGVFGVEAVAILLYYNRGKGMSSKIVFEKIPEEAKALMVAGLSSQRASIQRKTLPIYASFYVSDNNLRRAIKERLSALYPDLKEFPKQTHMDYLAKVVSSGNEITITQFSSGSLLLQGSYSDLVDRAIDIIDKIKPLSTQERALLFVPEENKEVIQERVDQGIAIFDRALADTEATQDECFAFLFENDQKSFITGEGLTEILENQSKVLREYNFLVAIYAKVFEGFLIRLMIEKGFFTLEEYFLDPDKPDIGNALRKRKFEKYIMDKRRCGHVIETMISVWEGCRCKEMHSDPVNVGIISVATLEDAKNRIGWIKTCMKDAYNVLVKHGYKDANLHQKTTSFNVEPKPQAKETHRLKQNGYIGTDESGKGDYFGPLVVAGVYLDPESEERLRNAGVRDSKKLSDGRIMELANTIRSYLDTSRYSVVLIGPEKYNDLYDKMGNLNRLLAWGHARSIENILATVDCNSAISDQFGDQLYIEKALLEKGKGIELLQMPKAEEHVAVAAASVLAREAFLIRLAGLSKEFGIELPKGASIEVENTARRIVERHGMSSLRKCAKLHFKTTHKL